MISITGTDPFSGNRGVSAMCMATIDVLRKTIPQHKLKIITSGFDPDYSASLYISKYKDDKKVELIKMPKNRIYYIFYLMYSLYLSIAYNMLKRFNIDIKSLLYRNKILKTYLQSDAIVCLNAGDGFTDIYGVIRSILWIHDYLPPLLLNKKVIFFPQTIGPFNNPITRLVAKFILNKVKIVIVREEISERYIKNRDISDQKILLLPDMAMALEAINLKDAKKILNNEEVPDVKEMIGISLRDLFTPNCVNKATFEKYLDLMVKTIDYIIDKYGIPIVLVSHHELKKFKLRDVDITIEILAKIKNKDKVYWIHKREYAVEELKGIIGRCDLFIGAYMHANIGALSMCVPTIGLSYSHKFQGIFEMLGQEKYVLNLKNLNYEELILKVEDAWTNREKIRKELEARMPEVKKQVMFAGELVKKVLGEQESI
ncbi:hypothetical protein CVT91_07860 [Candidatus Atribacteria bacterium HGW-Atribacteria-1]|nr:MAG: hypothetical protein CVT91_07860 [Candidatus Atribacteria bacterium HGW-Atribacteria-1]